MCSNAMLHEPRMRYNALKIKLACKSGLASCNALASDQKLTYWNLSRNQNDKRSKPTATPSPRRTIPPHSEKTPRRGRTPSTRENKEQPIIYTEELIGRRRGAAPA